MKHRVAGLIFVVAVCHQLFYLHMLPLSLSIDSYGYMSYADNLLSGNTPVVRTPGYPLLIAATGVLWRDSLIPLVLLQMLLVTAVPALCFYALLPAGRRAALIASGLCLAYAYPYTMTLQVMTESTYMCGIFAVLLLFAIYCQRRKLSWLITAFAVAIVTAEIRPSANLLAVCVTIALAALAVRERTRRAAIHAAVALLVTVAVTTGRNAITERNSANLTPYFIWHWISLCQIGETGTVEYDFGVKNASSCVSLENGPVTRELYDTVRAVLRTDKEAFTYLASGRDFRGAASGVRPEFSDYSDVSVDRLVDDLIRNVRENAHRGPNMITALWAHVGMDRTGDLVRGTIMETLLAHPQIVTHRLRYLLTAVRFQTELLRFSVQSNPNALNENVYWQFVPASLRDRGLLEPFSAGSDVYAQWILGLDRLTGTDPEGRQMSGRFPLNATVTWNAFRRYGNDTIVAMFAGNWLTRMATETLYLLSFVLIWPALRSRLWPVAVAAFAASWGLTTASYLVLDTYRQIVLHVMPLFVVTALGSDVLIDLIGRRFRRAAA